MTKKLIGSLMAGVAKVDITPVNLEGLTNLWRTPFEGVHDPIFVRALVLDNGINRIAIVAADLVEFGDTIQIREMIERELNIPKTSILITASHDHNAPRAGTVTPGATAQKGGPATEQYTLFVYQCIFEAVQNAIQSMQSVRVGVGRGKAHVNTYRNVLNVNGWSFGDNPDGPSDKTVWVVKLETLTGELIAILMNYAVHSVVLRPDNTLVSGDLAGATARFVEQFYDGKVVALWTMGAAGDQSPRYVNHDSDQGGIERSYRLMESMGQMIGEEVIQVAGQIERMLGKVRIEADERLISLPARIPSNHVKRPGMEIEKVDSLNIRLGVIMIGHMTLATVSGEVATKIYWHLLREAPFTHTIMVTLANDRIGYIIDDEAYNIPSFESTATPIQPGYAESAIVNNLVEMMRQY